MTSRRLIYKCSLLPRGTGGLSTGVQGGPQGWDSRVRRPRHPRPRPGRVPVSRGLRGLVLHHVCWGLSSGPRIVSEVVRKLRGCRHILQWRPFGPGRYRYTPLNPSLGGFTILFVNIVFYPLHHMLRNTLVGWLAGLNQQWGLCRVTARLPRYPSLQACLGAWQPSPSS